MLLSPHVVMEKRQVLTRTCQVNIQSHAGVLASQKPGSESWCLCQLTSGLLRYDHEARLWQMHLEPRRQEPLGSAECSEFAQA